MVEVERVALGTGSVCEHLHGTFVEVPQGQGTGRRGGRACVHRDEDGARAGVVWNEVAKALR